MAQLCNKIEYSTSNDNLKHIIDLLKTKGFDCFCIFGGAVRDSDDKQKHKACVKDYDIRIWSEHQDHIVCSTLSSLFGNFETLPCIGTDKVHYIFSWKESIELDISIRQKKEKHDPDDCAKDRVANSDIGLSAIAMASNGNCWCTPEYVSDRDNCTITIVKDAFDNERINTYCQRLQKKYPMFAIKSK